MAGKRVLITGASSGIGLSLAEQLANAGHQVTITVRDADKAESTKAALAEKQVSVDVVHIDFSIWSSVLAGVDEIIQNKMIFDIVIFNAGTMFPEESTTADGIETCLQVNVLGHMYLADVLLNHRPPRHNIHFVCVSSALFKLCGASWPRWKLPKEASAWAEAFAPRTRSGWRAYALSKFAITLLASRLNRVEGATAVAVNPGNAVTNVSKNMPDRHRKMLAVLAKKTLIPVEEAAANVVRASLNPLPAGKFYDQSKTSSLPKALTSERYMHNLNHLAQQLVLELSQ
ncbi:oxidoreductase, short chain dehydrogenase/reductase family protein [Ancylostoma duodenale]|uniref:Oxidoreductase, short chain dehydrogenase/reductase family protein n=1 Tax=Ancylostoma duodenale TaxID=51022 RepID=A0A0C2GYQ9_9BILA|nr:oxidoreductase, short chain dehydrogenase/reductase family protein [Ancylostoma duodenale]